MLAPEDGSTPDSIGVGSRATRLRITPSTGGPSKPTRAWGTVGADHVSDAGGGEPAGGEDASGDEGAGKPAKDKAAKQKANKEAQEQREIQEALQAEMRLLADDGLAILITDHAVVATFSICDQVAVLNEGRVLVAGPPDVVEADPRVRAAYLGP